jgi:hypothetical protein
MPSTNQPVRNRIGNLVDHVPTGHLEKRTQRQVRVIRKIKTTRPGTSSKPSKQKLNAKFQARSCCPLVKQAKGLIHVKKRCLEESLPSHAD